jgi:hypothetical protein
MMEIPDGWKLVPMKHDGKAGLTPEMFDAFWVAFTKASEHRGHFESVNAGYNAMLAAAPLPPPDRPILRGSPSYGCEL